jgi:hypothetical protein
MKELRASPVSLLLIVVAGALGCSGSGADNSTGASADKATSISPVDPAYTAPITSLSGKAIVFQWLSDQIEPGKRVVAIGRGSAPNGDGYGELACYIILNQPLSTWRNIDEGSTYIIKETDDVTDFSLDLPGFGHNLLLGQTDLTWSDTDFGVSCYGPQNITAGEVKDVLSSGGVEIRDATWGEWSGF